MNREQIKNNDRKTRKSILVCDDESDLLLMFQIHLESQYNVMTVVSGKACIDKINELKKKNEMIDLVLLDYKLGDISGEDVARKLVAGRSVAPRTRRGRVVRLTRRSGS